MLIRIVDIETLGLKPPAGICEVGWVDIRSERTDLAGAPSDWRVVARHSLFVDPGTPIPPEASAIHHIIDEDVRGSPTWADAAPLVFTVDPPDLVVAHNAAFERQWCTPDLTGSVPWACTYKAALRLWADAPGHSNQTLRYWRKPEGLRRDLAAMTHRAMPDAYVSAHLLMEMLADGATVEQLIAWSAQPALQVRCHLGKWRGTPWREVDEGFLEWVLARDFDEDVLFTAETELTRRHAERATERARLAAERATLAPAVDRLTDDIPF